MEPIEKEMRSKLENLLGFEICMYNIDGFYVHLKDGKRDESMPVIPAFRCYINGDYVLGGLRYSKAPEVSITPCSQTFAETCPLYKKFN